MKAQISLRTSTLNNDYYEVVKNSTTFGSEIFEIIRDRAYDDVKNSKISFFVMHDKKFAYVGCWINVWYYTTQNVIDKKYANTKRVGENETHSCVSLRIPISELESIGNREIIFSPEIFLNLWEDIMQEDIWNSEQGNIVTVEERTVELAVGNDGYYKPYYDRLKEMGLKGEKISINTENRAISVINVTINNLIRWQSTEFALIGYVPSDIDKKIDVDSTLYLNTYLKENKLMRLLKKYCKKSAYFFDRSAFVEIIQAGRYNLETCKEIVDKVNFDAKNDRVTAEMCIRILDKQNIGYDGLTKEDITALRYLNNGIEVPKIMEELNMEEVRFNNQIFNFLLSSNLIKSNGKEISVTKKGKEVVSSLFIDKLVYGEE